jgi:hypothetical protein
MSSTREFTESWLQALTLSATNEAARGIRPWMTAIASLGASEALPDQLDAAKKLWEFGSNHGLLGLLSCTPFRQPEWRFEEDESFVFQHPPGAETLVDEDAFMRSLAIQPIDVPMIARATQSDWTNWIRKEAVRRSKPLSVAAIPQGSMVDLTCTAHWDTKAWSIRFPQPDWLVLEQPGIFHAQRPKQEAFDALMIEALSFANKNLQPTAKLSQFQPSDAPWMACVPQLYVWHRSVLLTEEFGGSPWFRRVWNGVWPVIYRERNRLRGPCDLQYLRTELADCFASAPRMVEWMFVFARLVMEIHIGGGLGISGDFKDE